eukprot:gene22488-29614_t
MAKEQLQQPAKLRIALVKGLASVLHAIKAANKQVCSVKVDDAGLEIHWEEDSKALQASVYFRTELFSIFSCPGEGHTFGIQFGLLVDTLNVFASIPGASLDLSYPGPNQELVYESTDDNSNVCTYARVNSLETPQVKELEEYWEDPSSYFLVHGTLLKEVIDDLEWPNADVELVMVRDPQQICLSATGSSGALEIQLPMADLSGFQCSGGEVRHSYKHKLLKAAFCNLPNPKEIEISTKVSVDRNGLLRVVHVIPLQMPQQQQQQQPPVNGMDSQDITALVVPIYSVSANDCLSPEYTRSIWDQYPEQSVLVFNSRVRPFPELSSA